MSEDDVQLLGKSGVSHMGFGTESASKDVLWELWVSRAVERVTTRRSLLTGQKAK